MPATRDIIRVGLILTAFFFGGGTGLNAQEGLRYLAVPTLPLKPASIEAFRLDFSDTIVNDTLYQARAANGFPLSYSRKIETSVCFDNKCRLLNIILHWNITGRYLGFELPPGEFLSKAEHEPLNPHEYERLHALLGDAHSPLAQFSYNELVPRQFTPAREIDAVSSPTAKHLLEYVVPGAAFTTFKLWHIVHGVTQKRIDSLTAHRLSSPLFLMMLKSPVNFDRLWALNHRGDLKDTSTEVRNAIFDLMLSENYNVAERAIHAITSTDLVDQAQLRFVDNIHNVDQALKKQALMKLKEAEELTPQVVSSLSARLPNMNGDHLGVVLDIFAERGIRDEETLSQVVVLLTSSNFFISKQAYEHLRNVPSLEPHIQKKLQAFKKEHGLP